MNAIKSFIVLFSLVLLTACGDAGLDVTAKFENTQDIQEGVAVYHKGKKVGKVSDVSIKETGSVIEVILKPDAAKNLAAKSAIVVNRLKKDAPLEIYSRVAESGSELQAGQEIEGLDSMFQLGAWMVGDVVQLGTGSLSKYVGAFQEYLNGQEFEQNKEQVQKQMTDVAKSATEAVKRVEEDVVAALNDFSINEEQMAQTIEKLGEELSPVVGEVARSSTELVGQLEQFIVNIETNADLGEQQTGEKFLQSLVDTFEKLNKSIQEGAEKGQETNNATNK